MAPGIGKGEVLAGSELYQPWNTRPRCSHLGPRPRNRRLGEIDADNREPAPGEREREVTGATADVEHGTGRWKLVKQRDQVWLRRAYILWRRLGIDRIEKVA